MQFCMPAQAPSQPRHLAKLTLAIRAASKKTDLNISELSRRIGIQQSQASRIINGRFQHVTNDVMQFCIYLGIDWTAFAHGNEDPSSADDLAAAKARIQQGVLTLWDGSLEDANQIFRLLTQLSQLRGADRG